MHQMKQQLSFHEEMFKNELSELDKVTQEHANLKEAMKTQLSDKDESEDHDGCSVHSRRSERAPVAPAGTTPGEGECWRSRVSGESSSNWRLLSTDLKCSGGKSKTQFPCLVFTREGKKRKDGAGFLEMADLHL